jgi:hypothetical protein
MTEEQKLLQIKEIQLQEEMRDVRYRVLKRYKDEQVLACGELRAPPVLSKGVQAAERVRSS